MERFIKAGVSIKVGGQNKTIHACKQKDNTLFLRLGLYNNKILHNLIIIFRALDHFLYVLCLCECLNIFK